MVNPSPEQYKIRLILPNGKIDVVSPITAEQFYREMTETVTKNSTDVNWTGWYGFKNIKKKFTAVNIRMVIGVEEL